MEMVAAARLRRAEQRIEALRPYASAIRRMTRQAAEAAGNIPHLPILNEHENEQTRRRSCWSRATAASPARSTRRSSAPACARAPSSRARARRSSTTRPAAAACPRSPSAARAPVEPYTGFTDRPSYADAREIASDLMAAYVDGERRPRRDLLQRLHLAADPEGHARDAAAAAAGLDPRRRRGGRRGRGPQGDDERRPRARSSSTSPTRRRSSAASCPPTCEISIYRALLESTASEHGARMTAMRNASENADDIIDDLTLQMNRERQAEITQEIMEVVAGAESLI